MKKNFQNFIDTYNIEFTQCLFDIDQKKLQYFIDNLIIKIKSNNKIYICGNGGSWAIANHLLCDFNKNLYKRSKKKYSPKFISLSSNLELISAIANDIDYSDIFSFQLENLACSKDSLFVISSSGNSENIKKAIKTAKKKKISIFSLTGFDGGFTKLNSSFNVNISSNKYSIIEDLHQYIMHLIVEFYSI